MKRAREAYEAAVFGVREALNEPLPDGWKHITSGTHGTFPRYVAQRGEDTLIAIRRPSHRVILQVVRPGESLARGVRDFIDYADAENQLEALYERATRRVPPPKSRRAAVR